MEEEFVKTTANLILCLPQKKHAVDFIAFNS
jgi:hypothetical protein